MLKLISSSSDSSYSTRFGITGIDFFARARGVSSSGGFGRLGAGDGGSGVGGYSSIMGVGGSSSITGVGGL